MKKCFTEILKSFEWCRKNILQHFFYIKIRRISVEINVSLTWVGATRDAASQLSADYEKHRKSTTYSRVCH